MQNLMNMLDGLNEKDKSEAVRMIMSKYKESLAVDSKLYTNKQKTTSIRNKLFELMNTTDPFLEALIRLESESPYSIFTYVMRYNFSDIIIHKDGIIMSDSNEMERYEIPEEMSEIYMMFANHFIDNIQFIAGAKFDTGNSILDAEIGIFRFNLIHRSLTNSGFHVIVIRKATMDKKSNLGPEYINSINASQAQVDIIHRMSESGNVVVFGQTGSGKTTLLKYMGNYKLSEKRNLCTIEDTAELNIPVPIALVTNAHKKIKDLFTASLRQNPSHVIIGETRTEEIVDILEAALTTNVLTTIHANSLERAIQRIIFMSRQHEGNISSQDMEDLMNATIDCWIFMDSRKIAGMWVHKKGHLDNIYDAYERIE